MSIVVEKRQLHSITPPALLFTLTGTGILLVTGVLRLLPAPYDATRPVGSVGIAPAHRIDASVACDRASAALFAGRDAEARVYMDQLLSARIQLTYDLEAPDDVSPLAWRLLRERVLRRAATNARAGDMQKARAILRYDRPLADGARCAPSTDAAEHCRRVRPTGRRLNTGSAPGRIVRRIDEKEKALGGTRR